MIENVTEKFSESSFLFKKRKTKGKLYDRQHTQNTSDVQSIHQFFLKSCLLQMSKQRLIFAFIKQNYPWETGLWPGNSDLRVLVLQNSKCVANSSRKWWTSFWAQQGIKKEYYVCKIIGEVPLLGITFCLYNFTFPQTTSPHIYEKKKILLATNEFNSIIYSTCWKEVKRVFTILDLISRKKFFIPLFAWKLSYDQKVIR